MRCRDQLITTNASLFLSWVSPCCFTVSVSCLKLAKFHQVWEGDLCEAIDLKLPLSGRVQLMSRLLRNGFSWFSDWNDVEPLWLKAKWSQPRTYYWVLPKPNQSCSDSESAPSLLPPFYAFTIEGKAHSWKPLSPSAALFGPEWVGASAFQRSPHWRQPIRMRSLCMVHGELEEAPRRTCQYLLF